MWLVSSFPVAGNLPFELKPGEFAIGRSPECQIVVRDSSISRVHARLTINPAGDIHLVDLGSHNGTFVNDSLVLEVRPVYADRLRLGAVSLRFSKDVAMHLLAEDATEESTLPGALMRLKNPRRLNPDLTRSQREVLQLIKQGMSEEEAAKVLARSFHTVHTHLRTIYVAYGVHSRGELLARLNG